MIKALLFVNTLLISMFVNAQFTNNSLSQSVDNTSYNFQTSSPGFFNQSSTFVFDNDALRSRTILNDESTTMFTSVTGPISGSFYWRVSSEENFDFLVFAVVDNQDEVVSSDSISGNVGWRRKTFSVPSGQHLLVWGYVKDVSLSRGSDTGWIDRVVIGSSGSERRSVNENNSIVPVLSLLLLDDSNESPNCTLDSDGDRLANCYETNTGVFVNSQNTGTDPFNADTDLDGINDGDETLGTVSGLDLPAMGTNPLKKNILIEYDWFDDSLDCGAHSHRPTQAQINLLTQSFANSPVINPDGSTGIDVINDFGQGGVFSGGNLILDSNGVLAGGVNSSEFATHKSNNFSSNRNGYFHYAILPHRYNTTSGSSGQAEILGDDLIVSLQCFLSTTNVANTIMHELGHNLNLRHGGDTNCNYKPNYNSVMNYRYQFPGVDTDCNVTPNGVLDYSDGSNRTLNENSLNEFNGVCSSPLIAVDWDGDNVLESAISRDINSSDNFQNSNCGGVFTTLLDHDDWTNLRLSGLSDSDGKHIGSVEIISCNNHPTH